MNIPGLTESQKQLHRLFTNMPAAAAADLIVRPCFQQDLELVQLIYAHHVMTGAGTFDLVPPDIEAIAKRWTDIVGAGWPYFVACPRDDPSRVMGYAYAVQFRDRPAYAKTFEVSVYSSPTTLRKGAASLCLSAVLQSLQDDGVRQAVAFIGDSANAASIALHRKLGFQPAGILREVGEKFGRRLDVVIMQRPLARN